MIRVRFDTGLVLQYNDAHWFVQSGEHAWLYESEKKTALFAVTPPGAVVELRPPCRVYRDEGTDTSYAASRIEALVRRNIRLQRMNRELRQKAKGRPR